MINKSQVLQMNRTMLCVTLIVL